MNIVDRLDADVLGAIRRNLGAEDENDTSKDARINEMDAADLFQCYCNWHGLLGWSYTLSSSLDNIRSATRANVDSRSSAPAVK